jgi:hypothetical protein
MKAVVAALAVVLSGCVVPGVSQAKEDVPIPDGQGQLVVQWAGEPGRTVLGSSWAATSADAFDLILLGASGNRYAALDQGWGQAIGVDPGTYRVYVLAGIKRSSGSATAELIGAAATENVVIELGKRTRVDLVLKSIDLDWQISGPAYYRGSLGVGMTGKSRTSGVGMSLAGSSTTQRPRFKSMELWNGYHECSSVTGTPDDWRADATATVPGSGTNVVVGVIGASVCLQGLDGQWFTPTGLTAYTWTWPNRADLADTHPLVPFAEVSLPCQAPPTGVDVAITWE